MGRFTEIFTNFQETKYDEIPMTIIDEIKERYNSESEKGDTDLRDCLQTFEKYYHSPVYKIDLQGLTYDSILEDRLIINDEIFPMTKEKIFKTIEKVDVHTVSKNKIHNHLFYDYEVTTPINFSFKYLYDQKSKNPGKQKGLIKNYIKPFAVMPTKTGNSLYLSIPSEIVDYFKFNSFDNEDILWKIGLVDNSTDDILLIPYKVCSTFSIYESSITNEREFLTGEPCTKFYKMQFFKESGTGHIISSTSYKIKFFYWKEIFSYNEFEQNYQDITLSKYPPYALYVDIFGQIHLQRMAIIPESYHNRSDLMYIPTAILSQLIKESQFTNKQITYERILQKLNLSYSGFCADDFESFTS